MPVCCTAMALGVVPADLPNYTGMIGMHGTVTSNKLANECDLFIALGARFSDRVATNFKTFAPNARFYILILTQLKLIRILLLQAL